MPRAAWPVDQLSPTSRYRLGYRDAPDVREAHAEESRNWRRRLADAVWTPVLRDQVVAMLEIEPDPAAVMTRLGMGASALYGRMAYDDELRSVVESVLADCCRARNYSTAAYPAGACGTATGYKHGAGRCQACRDAHRAR